MYDLKCISWQDAAKNLYGGKMRHHVHITRSVTEATLLTGNGQINSEQRTQILVLPYHKLEDTTKIQKAITNIENGVGIDAITVSSEIPQNSINIDSKVSMSFDCSQDAAIEQYLSKHLKKAA